MIKTFMAIAALLVCVSLALGQEQNAADQKLIESLYNKSLNDAWEAHDATALAENFTEDADFTNVRGTHAHGRKAIVDMHEFLFKGPFKDSHIHTLDMQVRFLRDDLAAIDLHWEMTGANLPDGTPWPDRKGLANAIVEKQNGKWLIAVSHNMDLPDPQSRTQAAAKPAE
jgi:uncharacterized protein (TIGR02246 family)